EGREFHLDPDPRAKDRYLAKVDDVARDIHQLLKAMKGPPSNPEKKAPADSVTSVYLAWTTSDRNDDRDSIRRELVDRNFDVFPKSDPPLDSRSLASVVANALDRCDYSIHPIGARFGIVPEGENRSITWLQHEIAAQRYRRGGVWGVLGVAAGCAIIN